MAVKEIPGMPENYDGKPGNRPASDLWQRIHGYFTAWFIDHPKEEELRLTPNALCDVMTVNLHPYDPEVILELLRRGYQVSGNIYVFKRQDFISERKNRLEGVEL